MRELSEDGAIPSAAPGSSSSCEEIPVMLRPISMCSRSFPTTSGLTDQGVADQIAGPVRYRGRFEREAYDIDA